MSVPTEIPTHDKSDRARAVSYMLSTLAGLLLITATIGGTAAWLGFVSGLVVQMFRMGWLLARAMVGP